jgi:simple sugar transport system substrate-binding protein
MVTHEAPGSTFWDRIRAGAEQAAEQHGIELKYSNDPDSGKQATLIQNAIDSKVDGIAVTLANPTPSARACRRQPRPASQAWCSTAASTPTSSTAR